VSPLCIVFLSIALICPDALLVSLVLCFAQMMPVCSSFHFLNNYFEITPVFIPLNLFIRQCFRLYAFVFI